MFVKIALVLLAAWALGIGWLYPHKPVHVLLFAGLMLLLLGFLKTLDAAKRGSSHDSPKQP